YKFDIPPGTAIPRWMYQDPTQNLDVTFNNTLAYDVSSKGQPDVTSNTNNDAATTTGNTSASTTPSSASSGGSSSSSSNIGAIVGGVIGGLGFLIAALIIGWWYLRRRHSTRSSQAPSKQYIAKWSKEVPVGQAPSRWGGTSYGSDSVMGDTQKERDLMMSPTSTLPNNYAYSPEPKLPYASNRPSFESHHRNRSREAVPQAVAYYPSSPPSSFPAKRQGHKKDHSGSSSFSRKLMGIPATADNITPFYLPPAETTVTNDPEMAFSPSRSDGRPSLDYSIEPPANRTRPSKPSRKSKAPKAPLLTEPLPSTIEYFQSKPPPLASNNVTSPASTTPYAPSTAPYGRTSTDGNRSRSSFTGSRAGYFSPDDPATYPTPSQTDGHGRAPSSRRTSADQLPGPVPVAQPTTWMDAAAEKAALAGRDYTPQTMPTPGHSGYAHSTSARNAPSPPTSPYGAWSMDSPSQPLVGGNLGLTNSVHTIPVLDNDEPEIEHPSVQPVHQTLRQDSSEGESAAPATVGGGNGFFSALGRRVRPGGRSNESNNSQPSAGAPGRQFSIHVRNSQVGRDEFDPYRPS
ncbi:hypothetical protein FRB90_002629, partial [Tulasnella sp. 427]